MPTVEAELKTVENLIAFYDTQGHLNDREAQTENLSYLKAAALCWVLRLEAAKASNASPRVRAAFDTKIFGIVQQFWVAHPMNRVELPPALRDYVAQRASRPEPPTHQPRFDIGRALARCVLIRIIN